MTKQRTYNVYLPELHDLQKRVVENFTKRNVFRAGRRTGKTFSAADLAVEYFIRGKRVLYAAPTSDQLDRFWTLVCRFLEEPIAAGVFKKNESKHIISLEGTDARIKAKTAWSADTLRGDFADLLILDEFQLMHESAWDEVGAPMLADTNGDALFIYTPPSLRTRSVSKADDPRHASKMFRRAIELAKADRAHGRKPRWSAISGTSFDNPHLPKEALDELAGDMTSIAYRQEILAEDVDEAPGALWKRAEIEDCRVPAMQPEDFEKIVVGLDPSATSGGDEAGIVVVGKIGDVKYVVEDASIQGGPSEWAARAVEAYHHWKADAIIAETNQGGEMVKAVIGAVDSGAVVKMVHATRGKYLRAEPVSVEYSAGRVKHAGIFPRLEDEMCLYTGGSSEKSPNRLDAMVWAITHLLGNSIQIF